MAIGNRRANGLLAASDLEEIHEEVHQEGAIGDRRAHTRRRAARELNPEGRLQRFPREAAGTRGRSRLPRFVRPTPGPASRDRLNRNTPSSWTAARSSRPPTSSSASHSSCSSVRVLSASASNCRPSAPSASSMTSSMRMGSDRHPQRPQLLTPAELLHASFERLQDTCRVLTLGEAVHRAAGRSEGGIAHSGAHRVREWQNAHNRRTRDRRAESSEIGRSMRPLRIAVSSTAARISTGRASPGTVVAPSVAVVTLWRCLHDPHTWGCAWRGYRSAVLRVVDHRAESRADDRTRGRRFASIRTARLIDRDLHNRFFQGATPRQRCVRVVWKEDRKVTGRQ